MFSAIYGLLNTVSSIISNLRTLIVPRFYFFSLKLIRKIDEIRSYTINNTEQDISVSVKLKKKKNLHGKKITQKNVLFGCDIGITILSKRKKKKTNFLYN